LSLPSVSRGACLLLTTKRGQRLFAIACWLSAMLDCLFGMVEILHYPILSLPTNLERMY